MKKKAPAEVARFEKTTAKPSGGLGIYRYSLKADGSLWQRYSYHGFVKESGRWTKMKHSALESLAINPLDIDQVTYYFAQKGFERTR